ncbi:trace amine-associated receptor 8b-like [Ictidomys tridecemlineatus]|uniref:trace amine-associated receptor 8b-like n=1 Tax=Ictidomys tridecemlineatus TaxID=43179 RepID=UPI00038C6195|nr:trace amine-associated receptor 8b-like [Ictidomys tridecemlineatus]KAG3290265.1 trace amine-associated receptor 8b-like [Ictidomys tridecemlineatus]
MEGENLILIHRFRGSVHDTYCITLGLRYNFEVGAPLAPSVLTVHTLSSQQTLRVFASSVLWYQVLSGLKIAVSWVLQIMWTGLLFYTGISDDGMENLVSVLNCVGGCQIFVNQDWVLIDFLLFFIPTLVMTILYSKIFVVAKQQAIKIETSMGSSETESSSESYKARVARRERKAAKTLGVTVVAFLISWLPYTIDALIDAFMGFITPAYIYEICGWCAYYNSAMNPLIYALFYPWFRKTIKFTLSGEILKGSSSTISVFSEKV